MNIQNHISSLYSVLSSMFVFPMSYFSRISALGPKRVLAHTWEGF
jgi:hypothetical protein